MFSPERAPDRAFQPALKLGTSKGFPFSHNQHQLSHPSTEVLFGDPSKKIRPMTSKIRSLAFRRNPKNRAINHNTSINDMVRKPMMVRNARAASQKKGTWDNKPKYTNSFGQLANRSISPEKQKVYSFMYGSTNSLNMFRKRMSKVFLRTKKKAKREIRKPTQVLEVKDDSDFDQEYEEKEQSQHASVKESEKDHQESKLLSTAKFDKNQYLVRTQMYPHNHKSLSQYSSQPISTRGNHFKSHNPSGEKYEKPVASKMGEIFTFDSDTITSDLPCESSLVDQSLSKNQRRMQKSLKNHYNKFHQNIFYAKQAGPNKDQNLITNNHGFEDKRLSRGLSLENCTSQKSKKKRNISTALHDSNARQRLKSANHQGRVHHTSSGSRPKLDRSFDHKGSQITQKSYINDPQAQLEKILQYQLADEVNLKNNALETKTVGASEHSQQVDNKNKTQKI